MFGRRKSRELEGKCEWADSYAERVAWVASLPLFSPWWECPICGSEGPHPVNKERVGNPMGPADPYFYIPVWCRVCGHPNEMRAFEGWGREELDLRSYDGAGPEPAVLEAE